MAVYNKIDKSKKSTENYQDILGQLQLTYLRQNDVKAELNEEEYKRPVEIKEIFDETELSQNDITKKKEPDADIPAYIIPIDEVIREIQDCKLMFGYDEEIELEDLQLDEEVTEPSNQIHPKSQSRFNMLAIANEPYKNDIGVNDNYDETNGHRNQNNDARGKVDNKNITSQENKVDNALAIIHIKSNSNRVDVNPELSDLQYITQPNNPSKETRNEINIRPKSQENKAKNILATMCKLNENDKETSDVTDILHPLDLNAEIEIENEKRSKSRENRAKNLLAKVCELKQSDDEDEVKPIDVGLNTGLLPIADNMSELGEASNMGVVVTEVRDRKNLPCQYVRKNNIHRTHKRDPMSNANHPRQCTQNTSHIQPQCQTTRGNNSQKGYFTDMINMILESYIGLRDVDMRKYNYINELIAFVEKLNRSSTRANQYQQSLTELIIQEIEDDSDTDSTSAPQATTSNQIKTVNAISNAVGQTNADNASKFAEFYNPTKIDNSKSQAGTKEANKPNTLTQRAISIRSRIGQTTKIKPPTLIKGHLKSACANGNKEGASKTENVKAMVNKGSAARKPENAKAMVNKDGAAKSENVKATVPRSGLKVNTSEIRRHRYIRSRDYFRSRDGKTDKTPNTQKETTEENIVDQNEANNSNNTPNENEASHTPDQNEVSHTHNQNETNNTLNQNDTNHTTNLNEATEPQLDDTKIA
ncbi:hypothetical protein M8J76_000773 [Diaphorina citri]|nr:hypothetical protein M8J76_000773 [Diaphorina citri]